MKIKLVIKTEETMRGMLGNARLAVAKAEKLLFKKSEAVNQAVVIAVMLVASVVLMLIYYVFGDEIQQYFKNLGQKILDEILNPMDGIF